MGIGFFVRRWLLAFAVAGAAIGASHLLRQRGLDFAVREAVVWGAITASTYVAVLVHKWRRRCRLPADMGQQEGSTS
jgi:hypothetical protein